LKKLVFPFLAVAVLVAACAEPLPPKVVRLDDGRPGSILIESRPPGVTMEVNGKAVGKAPCLAQVPVVLDGGKWVLKDSVTVMALPEAKEQMLQTKFYEALTEPPKSVMFDMHEGASGRRSSDDDN
jgi:hypothetical protein